MLQRVEKRRLFGTFPRYCCRKEPVNGCAPAYAEWARTLYSRLQCLFKCWYTAHCRLTLTSPLAAIASMAPAFTNVRVWLCIVAAFIACWQQSTAAELPRRRALRSWVATSGSVTVETGLIPPHPFKTKSEWTFDHNAKAEEPEKEEEAAPEEEAPAPEKKKDTKGPGIKATFNKKLDWAKQFQASAVTKEVYIREQPAAEVKVEVDKSG